MSFNQRTDGLLLWINFFGSQKSLQLRNITHYGTIWCRHIPTLTHFCATGKFQQQSSLSPIDAYNNALKVLTEVFEQQNKHKHKIRTLSPIKAANGDNTEIYKFIVLFLFYVAISYKEEVMKFKKEYQGDDVETTLSNIIVQCRENLVGDSWWRLDCTPSRRSRSLTRCRSSRKEEVFTNSPVLNLDTTLNSPSFKELRMNNTLIEELEKENKVLRNQCQKNVESMNHYREYLEEAEDQTKSVSSQLQNKIDDLNLIERNLRYENKSLRKEKADLESELVTKEQHLDDLTSEVRDWKKKAQEAVKELERIQFTHNKLIDESENEAKTIKLLKKQLEESNKKNERTQKYLCEYEHQRVKVAEECFQLQQHILANKEELTYLRDDKYSLSAQANDLKRQIAILEKQVQDLNIKLESAGRELEREKIYRMDSLREKETEFKRTLEEERSLKQDILRELRQSQEKLHDVTELYNSNIAREKETVARYRQSKEEAEEKLISKKKEWDTQLEKIHASHERELNSQIEFKNYYEKKHQSVTEELDELRSHIAKIVSDASEDGTQQNMSNAKTDSVIHDQESKSLRFLLNKKDEIISDLRNEFSNYMSKAELEINLLENNLRNQQVKISEADEFSKMVLALLETEGSKFDSQERYIGGLFEENQQLKNELKRRSCKESPVEGKSRMMG